MYAYDRAFAQVAVKSDVIAPFSEQGAKAFAQTELLLGHDQVFDATVVDVEVPVPVVVVVVVLAGVVVGVVVVDMWWR